MRTETKWFMNATHSDFSLSYVFNTPRMLVRDTVFLNRRAAQAKPH